MCSYCRREVIAKVTLPCEKFGQSTELFEKRGFYANREWMLALTHAKIDSKLMSCIFCNTYTCRSDQ